MTSFSTARTQPRRRTLPQRAAFAFCLFVAGLIAGMPLAIAEIANEAPKNPRVVNYGPVVPDDHDVETAATQVPASQNSVPQNPASGRNRTMTYAPVEQRESTISREITTHISARPIDGTPTTGTSSRSGGRSSQRSLETLLDTPLPDPGGPITDTDIRRQIARIAQMTEAAKTGGTLPPATNASQQATTGDPSGGAVIPGGVSGLIAVQEIFQLQEGGAWYALKEGSNIPIPLIKHGEKYYSVDESGGIQSEVFVPRNEPDDATVADGRDKSPATSDSDKMRNAVLLIVTTIAVLAALSVGFLAFDYKYRWEQEIANQNNRLLGNDGTGGGSLTGLDPLEPETFSFASDDYGSLDPSFDSSSNHSFRTIA